MNIVKAQIYIISFIFCLGIPFLAVLSLPLRQHISPNTIFSEQTVDYTSVESLTNLVKQGEKRKIFIDWLPNDYAALLEFVLALKTTNKLLQKDLKLFQLTIRQLKNYMDVHQEQMPNFSFKVMVYKSLILLLSPDQVAKKFTLHQLREIKKLTKDLTSTHAQSIIKGIAGSLSGIYEVSVKRGTVLFDLPYLNYMDHFIDTENGRSIHEWDGVNDNSVFEFKFDSSLHKLYTQILGIKKPIYYLQTLSTATNPEFDTANLVNLVYWGENSSKQLEQALVNFVIKNHLQLNFSIEGSIAFKFTLDQFLAFVTDANTVDLLGKERREYRNLKVADIKEHIRQIDPYIQKLKKRAVVKKTNFDVIIGISNSSLKQQKSLNIINQLPVLQQSA